MIAGGKIKRKASFGAERDMEYILASKSPRRRELLGRIIKNFKIVTADTDESLPDGMHPREGVVLLSERKGEAVMPLVGSNDLVISSDTLVELDGSALGKPRDEAEAFKMLRTLSGRWHNVHTGIAVHYKGKCHSGADTACVLFRELSDSEILEYISTGEPMDKAGSYAIQGMGSALVSEYRGDLNTIIGLGLGLLSQLMDKALAD